MPMQVHVDPRGLEAPARRRSLSARRLPALRLQRFIPILTAGWEAGRFQVQRRCDESYTLSRGGHSQKACKPTASQRALPLGGNERLLEEFIWPRASSRDLRKPTFIELEA